MNNIHTPPGQAPAGGPAYLAATRFIDSDHPVIRAFAGRVTAGAATPRERAVNLFYAVRDGWRYDPFSVRSTPEHYVASNIHESKAAYCVPKAILLAAAARAAGIPAAVGFSDVKNHLTTDKLREKMGGQDLFLHHGYALLNLEGRWVKAAPAFNIELCERFAVLPTEFDGTSDAVFQEFDARDRRHMEYVNDRGCWTEVPFEQIIADFRAFYPPELFADHGGETERFEDGARAASGAGAGAGA